MTLHHITKRTALLFCLALLSGALPLPMRFMVTAANAQRHPPEIRGISPLGGSAGLTTRVTFAGVSFRNASKLLFDRPGITATILPSEATALPAPTMDSDGDPNVIADITIAKTTAPGLCHIRVVSPTGVSNAGVWMIGRDIPQIEEKEPNNGMAQAQIVTLPLAVHGTISDAGDQDTFGVELQAGQAFVAEVQANRLESPLDSLLILRDGNGREVAGNDDHNGPDSLLIYTPKENGRFFLTIQSGVGQGGPNFAYRLEMGALPLLQAIYPSSAEIGKAGTVTAVGVNLSNTPSVSVPLAAAAAAGTGRVFVATSRGNSNSLPVLLSPLPSINEQEPNDDMAHATLLPTPGIANGRFWHGVNAKPTDGPDIDFYRFQGEAGQRYVMDLQCQSIGTAGDPMLTLYGPDGKQIAENDDTGSRDAHLDMILPQAGDYTLRVKEVRDQTGPGLAYRLIVQQPQPGFALSTETRGRAVGQGDTVPFEVTVTRDRWEGPVVLGVQDLPPGVTSVPCIVPPGMTKGILLLTADKTAPLTAFPLHIVGGGQVTGTVVQRTLEAAADWVWKGGGRVNVSVPPNFLMFSVSEPFEITVATDVKTLTLARGQSATLKVTFARRNGYNKPVTLRMLGLPDGVTVADIVVTPDKSEGILELKAAPTARLGTFTLAATGVVANSPMVQLDRATSPIALSVTEPPKK